MSIRSVLLFLIMLSVIQVYAQKYKNVDHKNLGVLPSGSVDTQYFYVYDFNQKMTNLRFRSGCGCVSLSLDTGKKSPISHTIQFIYNSSGNVGPLNRYGIVYFEEDSVKDSIKLMVSAEVIQTHLNKSNLQQSYMNAIVFETTIQEFDSIPEGTQITALYKFINHGSVPIVITNAQSSCGCCFPSYSREPVKPGDSGFVKIHFNSSGKTGMNNKSVMVNFSNQQQVILTIKGLVVEREKRPIDLIFPTDSKR